MEKFEKNGSTIKVEKDEWGFWIWINDNNSIRINIDGQGKVWVTIWNKPIEGIAIYP